MAWFIIESERRTWTKYLVEADDSEVATRCSDRWEYLGYLDGDDTDSRVVGGPFEDEAHALADLSSHVEG